MAGQATFLESDVYTVDYDLDFEVLLELHRSAWMFKTGY